MPVKNFDSSLPISPLKWAGGKRWLVQKYRRYFEIEFKRFIEPFVGGGSVFFSIQPQSAIISDLNLELVETYKTLRRDWQGVETLLEQYDEFHSKETYYQIRASNPRSPIKRAARFIYLNRTCWNGLYRVNRRGEFNVPIGTKTDVVLDTDNFGEIANLLNRCSIFCCDFEQVILKANAGDLIFADPPYTINHNMNGFIKYNERLFTWDDQVRLRNAISHATKKGARALVTNANHPSIHKLYAGLGKKKVISRPSVISGQNSGRGSFEELLIIC